jgi:hypothetical protein
LSTKTQSILSFSKLKIKETPQTLYNQKSKPENIIHEHIPNQHSVKINLTKRKKAKTENGCEFAEEKSESKAFFV